MVKLNQLPKELFYSNVFHLLLLYSFPEDVLGCNNNEPIRQFGNEFVDFG